MSNESLIIINIALTPFIVGGTIGDWRNGWPLRLTWMILLGFILNNLYKLFYP